MGRDLLGRRLHVGDIGRTVGPLGGRHAEEHEVGSGHGLDAPSGEGEPPAATPSATRSSRPASTIGIARRSAASRRVALGQDHRVAEVGQGGGSRQPDVAGPDDRNCARVVTTGSCATSRRVRAADGMTAPGGPGHRASPAGREGRPGGAPCCRAPIGRARGGRGGSRSAVVMGFTRRGRRRPLEDGPGEAPPGGRPGLVTWKMPGGGRGRASRWPGQVGGEGRGAVLVVDEAKLAVARRPGAGPSPPCWRRGHRTPSWCARWSSRAGTRARRPAWWRRRPRSGWAGPTPVRPRRRPVEDVVGRHVDNVGADERAASATFRVPMPLTA